MRTINKIIVHCSDSDRPEHDDINEVRRWHIERGFNDVGYHYYINKNGTIFQGRPETIAGAHTVGENHDSIGVCLGGRKKFTMYQFSSLKMLVKQLREKYGNVPVYGHSHFNPKKTCPNFNVNDVINP